jgi:hypothetical protein
MNRFPKKNGDEPFSLNAVFAISDPSVVSLVRAYVDAWARANQTWVRIWRSDDIVVEELEFESEFLSAPKVSPGGGGSHFTIAFECRPSATRWKDWTIYLADEVQRIFPEVKLERFE